MAQGYALGLRAHLCFVPLGPLGVSPRNSLVGFWILRRIVGLRSPRVYGDRDVDLDLPGRPFETCDGSGWLEPIPALSKAT